MYISYFEAINFRLKKYNGIFSPVQRKPRQDGVFYYFFLFLRDFLIYTKNNT